MKEGSKTPASPRVRIRLNGHTVALGAVVVAMWYAATAQANGAVYLLAFATAGTALLSLLHARANLRGLVARAGPFQWDARLARGRLPVTLSSARAAFGLEVSAAGARASVFVGAVPAEGARQVELIFPAANVSPNAPLTVVIRSLYPLGFFTAELHLGVAMANLPPRPAGDLPLPAATPLPARLQSELPAGGPAKGDGDDFTGVRTWQPGDSPRHIDWKAAARGRPLLTKQWSGGGARSAVMLDWHALALPEAERASQLMKWVLECEARQVPFGLVLPGKAIQPGQGVDHAAACRRALGGLAASLPPAAGKPPARRVPFAHETSAPVSGWPLAGLGVALALTLLPMLGEVSAVAMGILLAAILWRVSPWFRPLPLWAHLPMVVAAGALVYLTEADFRTMEAATAMLLAFLGCKVAESRCRRDFQVVAVLGLFLCASALAIEQSLAASLLIAGVFVLLLALLARLRRGAPGARPAARVALVLMTQALPVVALMFLLFPRWPEDLLARLARRGMGQSGLSARLTPGSIANVALSSAVAFRVEFPDGKPPQAEDRYWRCIVLEECDGLSWQRGRGQGGGWGEDDGMAKVRQVIALEPHGDDWLPGLDRPVRMSGIRAGVDQDSDGSWRAGDVVDKPLRFTVLSQPGSARSRPSAQPGRSLLTTPASVSPAVRELAASFRRAGADDRAVALTALDYFRQQGFKYTLEPGTYEGAGLDEFLFDRRLGFCEHFSAAFATLMRLAGVPARVVVGFLGGELNEGGSYWIVRQSDTHAWTEVWLQGQGWTRLDPTATLAPERLNSSLENYLAGGLDGSLARNRNAWWWRTWLEVTLVWDRLNYEWYNRVVTAAEEAQRSSFISLGFGTLKSWLKPLAALCGGLAAIVLLVWLWLRRPARHPDPVVRLWRSFCVRLARAGLPRRPGEGAHAFAARAAAAFPAAAASLREIGALYNEQRYGHGAPNAEPLRLAVAQLPRLPKISGGGAP